MAYTEDSIVNFLHKNNFSADSIRYILREEGKTDFYLLDGRVVSSLIPLGHFQDYLPEEDFIRINKGVLVCAKQVVNVSKGMYLMTDGVSLEGRHHGMKLHTDFMRKMVQEQESDEENLSNARLSERFASFEDFPLPFCVIQLVFDVYGKSTSFIFRYCNKMMEYIEQRPVETILNHSFYDLFDNPDEKWLVKYGDIAKNGGRRVFRGFKDRLGVYVYIVCYQVAPGYCGCLLLKENWMDSLGGLYFDGDRVPL